MKATSLVLSVLILLCTSANAQPVASGPTAARPTAARPYVAWVKHYGPENGLAHREVNAIFQDRQGFMWFGTRFGLSRFDGKTFTNFTKDRNGLEFDDIQSIAQDADGSMWLGTSFGVYQVKVKPNYFRRLFYNASYTGEKAAAIRGIVASGDTVYASFEKFGLFAGNAKDESVKKLLSDPRNPPIVDLTNAHSPERLLAGVGSWLVDYDRKTGAQKAFELPNNSTIWTVHPFGAEQWLVGGRLGLWWVHPKTGEVQSFTRYNQFQELAQSHVLHIAPDRMGTFWICSGTGLYTVDPVKGITGRYWSGGKGRFYLPAEAYEYFYQDQNGIYWLGTANAGMIRWDRPGNKYRQFRRSEGLTNDNIHAIYPDRRGRLWLSSDRGIMQFDPVRLSIGVDVRRPFYLQIWFLVLAGLLLVAAVWGWLKWRIWNHRQEQLRLQTEIRQATARIEQDKEVIERQARSLHQLNEAKSRFFANISHEFRTPLTVILGMTSELKRYGPDEAVERSHDTADLIERNGSRLLRLINQILDLSKLESGAMSWQPIRVDLVRFARYVAESFDTMAAAKDIQMHFHSDEPTLEADFDKDKLQDILSNLLTNAIKFTPAGGHVYLRLNTVHADDGPDNGVRFGSEGLLCNQEYYVAVLPISPPDGEWVLIRICNTGLGIAADKLPLIFDRFFQVPGQSKPVLLLVEDNEDVAAYIVSALNAGYRIMRAGNGQAGIDLALETIPDLILTDVMMPVKDGYELCDTLKNNPATSHIPIVMLTARAGVSDRISGLRRGADAYLTKPFQREELEVVLSNLLQSRRRLWAHYGQQMMEIAGPGLPPVEENESLEDSFLLRLRSVLEAQWVSNPLSMEAICHQIGMSRSSLHRKMIALTGMSVTRYDRSLRMAQARCLLTTTPMNISEVAYAVGFEDPKYFSRLFSEEFNHSPTEFRRMGQ